MGFPDDRDRKLIRKAERTEELAISLASWVAEYNGRRQSQNLLPIPESEEFELTQLRRRAAGLYSSAKVPVAAAVYGPSQVGKSLFVGRVLAPAPRITARSAATSSAASRPTISTCRSIPI